MVLLTYVTCSEFGTFLAWRNSQLVYLTSSNFYNLVDQLPIIIHFKSNTITIWQLERIPTPEPRNNRVIQSSVVFHHLKMTRLNGFYGSGNQMSVVKFLLQKAILLETMDLVTHKEVIMRFGVENCVYKANSVWLHWVHFMNNLRSCQKDHRRLRLYYTNILKMITLNWQLIL